LKSIVVLMSLYNGAKYLEEQIDSILKQENVNLTLVIRNDGSKDNSNEIISKYLEKYNNIKLIDEENIGLARSFMKLLYSAKLDYDYYCFADQDDVWLPNKLYEAIIKLENKQIPTLYASNQSLVDSNLVDIGIRYKDNVDVTYKQIISNNKIAGCTFVWNKKLQEILSNEKRRPSDELLKKRIHDVWVAAVASVAGEIIYDSNSYIRYRQHQNNVVGVKKQSRIKTFIKKYKNKDLRCGRSTLAKELYFKYNDLIINEEIKNELNILGNYQDNRKLKKELLKRKDIYKVYNNESNFEFKFKVNRKLF